MHHNLSSLLFFSFYPSGQAIWNSLFLPDPFGLKTEFVGLDNFRFLLSDPYYLASFKTTIIFSTAVSVSSMAIGLYLAALADRLIKGSRCLSNIINLALRHSTSDRRGLMVIYV